MFLQKQSLTVVSHVFQFVWQMTRDTSITPPSILVNHPNHEGTVFSVFIIVCFELTAQVDIKGEKGFFGNPD